jgi:hypothetical protein
MAAANHVVALVYHEAAAGTAMKAFDPDKTCKKVE